MPLMRERRPRPATRGLSRGEVLGIVGLSSAIIGWVHVLGKRDPDAVLNCEACHEVCGCGGPHIF